MSRQAEIHDALIKRGFVYTLDIWTPDGELVIHDQWTEAPNRIPQQGIDYFANVALLGGLGPISNWYVGMFEGNFVPGSDTTAADLPGSAGETTAYSQTTRPSWDKVYDGVGVVGNVADRASFSFTASKTLYGAFLVSSSIKGGNAGTLLSIARFPTPRQIDAGYTGQLGVAITLVSTN
ncbi:MAG: hypothetical protein ACOH2R_08555 [Pseudomonas sp.]